MSGQFSSIVAVPPQSANRAEGAQPLVLNPTSEERHRHEFGEQPHLVLDSALPQHVDANALIQSTNPHTAHFPQSIPSNSNTSLAFSGVAGVGDAMANQSWLAPRTQSAVGTTNPRENSHAGNQLKRTEKENRERSLEDCMIDNTHPSRQRHQETQPQPTSSHSALTALPHHIPTIHAATAAEIALGISSPFNTRSDIRISGSTHDSRAMSRTPRSDQERKGMDTNISSIIESLSEFKDREEENTSRTSETGIVTSPGRMTPLNDSSDHGASELPRMGNMGIGTPSTVSTAPSTDDASLGTDYKLDDFLPNLLHGTPGHSRNNSWGEERLLPGISDSPHNMLHLGETRGGQWMQGPSGSAFPPQQHQWSGQHLVPPHQPRIASFRDANHSIQASQRNRSQPWQQQPQHFELQNNRRYPQDQGFPYPGHMQQGSAERQKQGHAMHQFSGYQQVVRKGYPSGQPPGAGLPAATPPRPRNQRPQGQPVHSNHRSQQAGQQGSSPHQQGPNPQRSSSEILKTLLRKKACLYEPDTSRSVALVTWLVGRELALEHGFFSRQQLQSGVHACVSEKIDSGTITRTKVNRCMQIILNSCFHYIIPRSDGTEEKGDFFKQAFFRTVKDDSFLLQYLPSPWNDLKVNRMAILEASLADSEEKSGSSSKSPSTPKTSPRLSSMNASNSPGKEAKEVDDAESKRAVLLCFNENVRSAEDVFRCHNEFIRDTANAAYLQLTAQEWRNFFGREAASAPYLWGNIGIPMQCTEADSARQNDTLGQMSGDEARKFRTTWCAKRYDHDHDLCGFAHVEVNGGWLRRNPSIHLYKDEMCSFVTTASEKRVGSGNFFLNECPKGIHCEFAHSMEEILYHPNRYKKKNCTAGFSRSGGCRLGDVCPGLHSSEIAKHSKRQSDGRSHGPRHNRKHEQANTNGKISNVPPSGSPIVYASPAPFSSFERQLVMPGLQCLFRRHCSVVRAKVRTSGKCSCVYSCFGDDWGINSRPPQAPKTRSGLPTPRVL